MNATVQAARQKAKAAYEKYHYDGTATVYQWSKVKDTETGLTKEAQVILYEDKPCHLSMENSSADVQSVSAAVISQTAKLFISPELQINAGSKIRVTQAGITAMYVHSGKSAVYDTHQEIVLDLEDEFA